MLFTYLEIKQQVASDVGATDDFTVNQAGVWINRALMKLAAVGTWSWQYVYDQPFPTVDGVATYELPVRKLNSLWCASPYRKLKMVPDQSFRNADPMTLKSTPFEYKISGRGAVANTRKILLYPTPDAVYPMRWDGIREIPQLVNDTDDIRVVTGMPDMLVDSVIDLAVCIGLTNKDDGQSGERLQTTLQFLEALLENDNHEPDERLVMRRDGECRRDWMDPTLPPQYTE